VLESAYHHLLVSPAWLPTTTLLDNCVYRNVAINGRITCSAARMSAASVRPAQRHAGEDLAILAALYAVYASARDLNPARWSGQTRNWTPVGAVTLNPERDCIVKAHSENNLIQPLAA